MINPIDIDYSLAHSAEDLQIPLSSHIGKKEKTIFIIQLV